MKPKGHKRACKCVICARKPTRKPRRKNAGYENQMNTLHEQAAADRARSTRRNSTVRIPRTFEAAGNPAVVLTKSELAKVLLARGRKRPVPPKPRPAKNNKGHYPRTGRGPKGNARWYILDLYSGNGTRRSARIKQSTNAAMQVEAAGLVDRKVGNHIIRKVELSGPYARKPTSTTARK